jgi:hypothetical protein
MKRLLVLSFLLAVQFSNPAHAESIRQIVKSAHVVQALSQGFDEKIRAHQQMSYDEILKDVDGVMRRSLSKLQEQAKSSKDKPTPDLAGYEKQIEETLVLYRQAGDKDAVIAMEKAQYQELSSAGQEPATRFIFGVTRSLAGVSDYDTPAAMKVFLFPFAVMIDCAFLPFELGMAIVTGIEQYEPSEPAEKPSKPKNSN